MLFFEFWTIIEYVLYVINLFMKKLFVQLLQWISRYKKRLVYWALALLIGQICFFNLWWFGINNVTYAVEPNTPSQNAAFQQKATDWLKDLSFFQRAFYVLLYPILALAWILVDNSFVYAEVFKFDAVLWQLWNIVRNLANYSLWFIFLYKIFGYLTSGQKSDDLKKLLTSTLIAWVWIQASWFLLAVLIDVSNIIAYGVWWLPIATLGQQTDIWNPYVFKTAIYVDTNTPDSVEFYLSTTSGNKKYISECKTFSYSYNNGDNKIFEELIVAPKMIYYYDGVAYKKTEQNSCHIWDDVYYFKGLYEDINRKSCSWIWCRGDQEEYDASLTSAIRKLITFDRGKMAGLIEAAKILEIGDAHAGGTKLVTYLSGYNYWLDVDNNWNGESLWLNRLQNVLSGNYVWVFTALYSSLLNAWSDLRISDVTNPWVYTSLLDTVLSLWHTIAVWIPLIAMVVLFVMRIGIIWMAIILSPFIILLKAFNFEESVTKMVDIFKYLSVKNLLGIIFSPAIICFAVSISAVLVRIISPKNMQNIMTEKVDVLWWLVQLNIAWLWLNIWRLVCCAIWVAISWFLVRSAIRASELWKSNIISWQDGKSWLKDLASKALWSVPIVPIPKKDGWLEFVWASTVFGWNDQEWILSNLSRHIKAQYDEENTKALDSLFDSKKEKEAAVKNRSAAYKDKLMGLTLPQIGQNWTNQPIQIWENKDNTIPMTFSSLEDHDKKDVIEAINQLSNSDQIQAFGNSEATVQIWNDKYTFRGSIKVLDEENKEKTVVVNKYLTDEKFTEYLNSNKYKLSS